MLAPKKENEERPYLLCIAHLPEQKEVSTDPISSADEGACPAENIALELKAESWVWEGSLQKEMENYLGISGML